MNRAIIGDALPLQATIMDIPPPDTLARVAPPASPAPTQATAPAALPLEAVVIALRPQAAGSVAAGFLLELDIGGSRVEAESTQSLPVGTRLLLRESGPGRMRVERSSTPPSALQDARIAEALRTELPRQAVLREVVHTLARQAAQPGLPAPLREAIATLLLRLPTSAQVQQPRGLREALRNSGSFLEPRLLRTLTERSAQVLPPAMPRTPAPGGAEQTAMPAVGAWGALRRLYAAMAGTAPPLRVATAAPVPTPAAVAVASVTTPGQHLEPTPAARAMSTTPASAPAAATYPAPALGSGASLARQALASAARLTGPLPSRVAGGVAPPAIAEQGIATATQTTSAVAAPPVRPASAAIPPATGIPPAAVAPSGETSTPRPAGSAAAVATPQAGATPQTELPAFAPGSHNAHRMTAPTPPAPPATSTAVHNLPTAGVPGPAATRPVDAPAPRPSPTPAPIASKLTPAPVLAMEGTLPSPATQPVGEGSTAGVLATDLKAQWQLLRAVLAAWSRQSGIPAREPVGTDSAPAPTQPGHPPPLYTARGQLAVGGDAPAPARGSDGGTAPPGDLDIVEQLLRQVDGVLARTRVHQLAALPEARPAGEAPAVPTWIAEIPLLHPRGVDSLQLRIEDHGPRTAADSSARQWQVLMSFECEALGNLHALVLLAGKRLRATLWVERDGTLRAARAALGELDGALRAQGVEVTRLECVPGRPPAAALQGRERLLDVRT